MFIVFTHFFNFILFYFTSSQILYISYSWISRSTDSVLTETDNHEGGIIQTSGYVVILTDIIVETIALQNIQLKDTEDFKLHQSCDAVVVESIHEHKKELVGAGFVVMVFRICVSAFVTICYIYNTPVSKAKDYSV